MLADDHLCAGIGADGTTARGNAGGIGRYVKKLSNVCSLTDPSCSPPDHICSPTDDARTIAARAGAMTTAATRKHVHPFPARMAPEIALGKIDLLTKRGDMVLDPMCGSGTVVRLAAEHERIGIGVDLDPLAVIITRTACHPTWAKNLVERAEAVLTRAGRLGGKLPDWIARDQETRDFVEYWFAPEQAEDLSRIARVLREAPRRDDPLRVAFSRMIVTKEKAASLARDTSHSRPHRVADTNDYNVFDGFVKSAKKLAALIDSDGIAYRPSIRRDDARALHFVEPASVDLTVTSPPYLNALDYLRGHRMSLVWMGWTIAKVRELRGESVGVERAMADVHPDIRGIAEAAVPRMGDLPGRWQGIVLRFTRDMDRLAGSLARVTKPGGHLVMVVADSQLHGVPISNAEICAGAATKNGFELVNSDERDLPTQHRYLPPPTSTTGTLAARMKHEVIFTFRRT
jgi:SAM-dependent methyltransferase